MTKIIELILTEDRVGNGTKQNPVRMCTELYTKDGKLVARFDPSTMKQEFLPYDIDTIDKI